MLSGKASGLRPPTKIVRSSSISSSTQDLANSRSASPSASGVLTENTDDFIVGNRVWVGGTKPGYIQYIGETKFAPGEWAGIVLDEPVGKNDGSVAGVKYFQCEPKKGVFSRLTKLTREPLLHLMSDSLDGSTDSFRASPNPVSTSRTSLSMSRSSTPTLDGSLTVGDKVKVVSASGVKIGTLRYLGTAEFSAGEWAGIELDEPVGKNDGSVNGKRYFTCMMKYGLFAPVSKVSKYRRPPPSVVKPAKAPIIPAATPKKMPSTPRRVGSQESVNTIGSTTSARSVNSKPRLGITALTTAGKPTRAGPSITATHTAMQGALKEKEQHIEQLLRERELEMADVAKSSAKLEEADRTLSEVRAEYQRYKEEAEAKFNKFKDLLDTKEKESSSLLLQLDEEKRKNEDLQFRLEEEDILKSELENAKDDEDQRIKVLEEKFEAERLERESELNFQNEEALAKYADEVETLQLKLKNSESIIKTLEEKELTEKKQVEEIKEELRNKSKRIEELAELNTRLLSDSKQGEEAEKKLLTSYTVQIDSLQQKLKHSEETIQNLEAKELAERKHAEEMEKESGKKSVRIEELTELNTRLLNASKQGEEAEKKLLASCTAEIESLKQKLKVSDEAISNLNNKNASDENRLREVTEELQKRLKDIEELKSTNANLVKESQQREEEVRNKTQQSQNEHQLELNDLKLKITNAEQSASQLNKQLNDLQTERANLENKLQSSEEKCLQQKIKFETEITEHLRFSGNNSAQLMQLNEQLRIQEKNLEESQQNYMHLEEEIKQVRNNNKAEIESSESKHKLEVEHLESTHKTEIESLKSEHKSMTESLELKHKSEIESFESKHKLEIENFESKLKLEVESLESKHKLDIESLETKSKSEIESVESKYKSDIESLESKHKLEIECLESKSKLEIENLESKHKLELENQLKEKNEKWTLKSDAEKKLIEAGIENLKTEVHVLEKHLEESKKLVIQLEVEKKKAEEENSKNLIIISTVEKNLEDVKNELNKLQQENRQLQQVNKNFEASNQEFCTELEQHRAERVTQSIELNAKEEKLATLREAMERLKQEFAHHQIELQQKLEEAKLDDITVTNMKNHIELQQRNLEEFQKDLNSSKELVAKLKEENAQIPILFDKVKQLEDKLTGAQSTIKEAETREKHLLSSFEGEKEMAQQLSETSKILLDQLSAETTKQQAEILSLKQSLVKNDVKLEELMKENSRLRQLKDEAAALTNGNKEESIFKQERDAFEAQVDFLNSVIVDMQKKVDDYQSKLQLLETGRLEAVSDVNLNEIKMKIAPRMFCDICDMFDLHETEDCPRQASSDSPPPTNHHGIRNQERPYCDICEVFGHWTNECDDNETF